MSTHALIACSALRNLQYTAGKYLKDARPPFDCGFECVGTVVAVGPACTRFKVGQHVAASAYGMFAEYVTLPENAVMVRHFSLVFWTESDESLLLTGCVGVAVCRQYRVPTRPCCPSLSRA